MTSPLECSNRSAQEGTPQENVQAYPVSISTRLTLRGPAKLPVLTNPMERASSSRPSAKALCLAVRKQVPFASIPGEANDWRTRDQDLLDEMAHTKTSTPLR